MIKKIVKRPCGYQGCKTLTKVDSSMDIPFLNAVMVNWCKPCWKNYNLVQKEYTKLLKKYNKKQIVNKRTGKIYDFKCSNDLSNYLYYHRPSMLKKIHDKIDKKLSRRILS